MRACSLRVLVASAIFAVGAVGLVGCKKPAPNYGGYQYDSRDYYEHVVRYPGETLGVLAKWYTGNSSNWSILAQENPQIDPRRIRTGMLIRIPRRIMIREKPYTPQGSESKKGSKGNQAPVEPDSSNDTREVTRDESNTAPQENTYSPPVEEATPEPTAEATPEETPTPMPTPESTPTPVVQETSPVTVTPPKEEKGNAAKKNREEILRELMDEY